MSACKEDRGREPTENQLNPGRAPGKGWFSICQHFLRPCDTAVETTTEEKSIISTLDFRWRLWIRSHLTLMRVCVAEWVDFPASVLVLQSVQPTLSSNVKRIHVQKHLFHRNILLTGQRLQLTANIGRCTNQTPLMSRLNTDLNKN